MDKAVIAAVPLVSVVLPAYNAGNYVRQAVESILSQTFADFELIAIDDGSSDDTFAILEALRATDSRMRVVSRPNRGLVATLNEGIDLARGEWMARMDADDISLASRLQAQLAWLKRTGADMCGAWIEIIGAGGGEVVTYPQSAEAVRCAMLFGTVFAHPTVMMRTAHARQLRYDPTWETCEDYDLWQRAEAAGLKLTNVPQVLLKYRRHPGQVSELAAARQQQLTQRIRRRCWERTGAELGVQKEEIDATLALREPDFERTDMDAVDRAFVKLLSATDGEPQAVILDHMTRLYFRAARLGLSTAHRWRKLHVRHDLVPPTATTCKLWVACLLRLDPQGAVFAALKSLDRLVSPAPRSRKL